MIQKELAFNNLKIFKSILDGLNIPFLLDGGTCLGAYRDRDFCKDDENDIDLTTWDMYSYLIPNIIQKSIQKDLILHWHYNGGELATQQLAMKKDGIKIDLMFKKKKGKWAWWTVYRKKVELIYKKVPIIFYENNQSILFYGEMFYIPKDIEKYLNYRYGNWKIPVHRKDYSCYSTDRCIVENYEKI